MDPITASGVFTLGKDLIEKASNLLPINSEPQSTEFTQHLNGISNSSSTSKNPQLQIQKLEEQLKSGLLKDPKTADFFQQNQSNQIFLEKRADGSVQFISSNGQSLILDQSSDHCGKANQLFDLCVDNKMNLTSLRPNAVTFNS